MLTIRRILVPSDCGPCGAAAYRHALPLARRFGAELHLVHADAPTFAVEDDDPVFLPPFPPDVRVVQAEVSGEGVAEALLDYARAHDVDLAVVGTHGRRGFAHLLLGSVAERVVREAACPVLAVHACDEDAAAEAPAVRRILVPADFSEHSDEAARYARALADLHDAEVDLLHVVDATFIPDVYGVGMLWYEAMPDVVGRCRGALSETAEDLLGARAGAVHVEVGSPATTVLDVAAHTGADLIVMATHGRTGLKRFALGSVAERVVQHAPCPVFVVKSFGKSLLSEPSAPATADAA
ncbi:MAG TPA: universal stress protein [Rubricoccaceae bacterium]|nr:universal stress protein [Rubricoccaceae bacterium]